MTKFTNGPAQGQTLMLKRAPVFLRVVEKGGKIDALDQLSDIPEPDENLMAYTLSERPAMAFIDGTKCKGAYPIASYHLVPDQPVDAVMRDDKNWGKWCEENAKSHPLILENEIDRTA
jgi:hypothetical protein